MAAPKMNYQGVTLTDTLLTVHFVMEVGLTIRFCSVKIPVVDLHTVGVVPAIDREVRRQLAAAWEMTAEDHLLSDSPWQSTD